MSVSSWGAGATPWGGSTVPISGTITASQISNASALGQSLITGSTQQTIRTVMGDLTISAEESASRALVLADQFTYLPINNAASRTITVPPNSSVAFPVGTVVALERVGAGALVIAEGSGVTVKKPSSATLSVAVQQGVVLLRKLATDTWIITGQVTGIVAGGTIAAAFLNAQTKKVARQAIDASPTFLWVAVTDETTAITTGTAKLTFRMPFAMTLTEVRASLTTVSSSGLPTINVKESGTTIFSTKLTIDANEKTSTTAATPAVISDANLADDAEMTVDIDVAGTGAAGLKLCFIGTEA